MPPLGKSKSSVSRRVDLEPASLLIEVSVFCRWLYSSTSSHLYGRIFTWVHRFLLSLRVSELRMQVGINWLGKPFWKGIVTVQKELGFDSLIDTLSRVFISSMAYSNEL